MPIGNEQEYTLCRDQKLGGQGNQLILDFAMLGLLPWDIIDPQEGCPSPDVKPPDDSDGCLVPSGTATLRYWCQGKTECKPSIAFLKDLGPDSCLFDEGDSLPMWLYLRYREDTTNSVTECRQGGTYDPSTRTCYTVTSLPGGWHDQRAACRRQGGEMFWDVVGSDFATFLSQLVADTGRNITELWAMGQSLSGARPVLNLTSEAYPADMDNCVSLTEAPCSRSANKHTVCALPPWPSQVIPNCPEVTFEQFDLTFPETKPGKTVSQPCGAGYTGSASYLCGVDGQWSSQYPDLSGCHSEKINTDDAKNRLDNGTEPVSDIVSDLATNVTEQTSQNKPLTSGDVINSVQLLPQMVSAQQAQLSGQADQDKEVVSQYVNNITYLVAELTRQEESWHSMPRANRSLTSSTLQTNVEQSAYLLAPYLNDTHADFNYDTIRVRTGRYTSLEGNLEYRTQQGSTVTLPDEVGRFNDSGNTTIVFVEYGNMDCLLQSQECRTPDQWYAQENLEFPEFVNSPVISASVDNVSVEFNSSSVTLRFQTRLSARQFNLSNVQCVFWNNSISRWSDNGCRVGAVTNDSVECFCDHLTSFATLMDINGIIQEGSPLDLVLGWLTTLGCVLSLLCLAACLLVFTAVPALRRDPSLHGYRQAIMSQRLAIHRNLCICLFAAEFILLVGQWISVCWLSVENGLIWAFAGPVLVVLTNRVGITDIDLTARPNVGVQRHRSMDKVSPFPDPSERDQEREERPGRLDRAGDAVLRVVTRIRADVSRYSLKRVHEEDNATPSPGDHETLRKLESTDPAVVGRGGW
ncbi:Adhesion G protein-coupled receptor L3 [Amphibalanus amphitrite]|uniref:Adhesion G protein-coupled receptor L3 n=1 Tax=Amphibalanus amphitrite TaxID=1232801 RepID=A0A6A4WPS1_AMPAM|nr:Adhesion G protein-coupled receptor L3 [Amphibalanus amphitrite]